jgi:hypothetical protein
MAMRFNHPSGSGSLAAGDGDPLADARTYFALAGEVASKSAGKSSSKKFASGFPVAPEPLLSLA